MEIKLETTKRSNMVSPSKGMQTTRGDCTQCGVDDVKNLIIQLAHIFKIIGILLEIFSWSEIECWIVSRRKFFKEEENTTAFRQFYFSKKPSKTQYIAIIIVIFISLSSAILFHGFIVSLKDLFILFNFESLCYQLIPQNFSFFMGIERWENKLNKRRRKTP